MARIPLGALTTLNLSTHLDPQFVDLYNLREMVTTVGYTAATQRLIFGTGGVIANITDWNTNSAANFSLTNPSVRLGIGYTAADHAEIQAYDGAGAGRHITLNRYGGNVGVGGSPSYALDLISPAAAVRIAPSTTTNSALLRLANAGGNAFVGLDSNTGALSGVAYSLNIFRSGAYPIIFTTNDVERMRVDSAGNVGVGSAPNNHGAGSVNMTVNATAASVYDLNLNGVRNCTWSLVDTQAQIGTLVSKPFILMSNNVERVRFETSGHVSAGVDNAQTLGTAAKRWSVVYAGTGSINTSDAREKTPITELSQAELAAAKELSREIGTFRLLASVAAKGDAARLHIGMTVQRAIEIMQGYGLEPFRYAFICYDSWPGDGSSPGGDRYSFRTDELALFLARGFDARLAELESS